LIVLLIRRILFLGFGAAVLGVVVVAGCNVWVWLEPRSRMFDNVRNVPENRVGLVLGTSKRGPQGYLNPYFVNRIAAAARLYSEGKVKHLLVSGDNRHSSYNEPEDFRDALVERGVSKKDITLDYAGFRTLDSVVRAKRVFGLRKVTIISQDFHARRALYIAKRYGIDAVGFAAKEVPRSWFARTRLREVAARVRVVLDLYIFRTKPRFLGEKIEIAER
jgi:SanA protein